MEPRTQLTENELEALLERSNELHSAMVTDSKETEVIQSQIQSNSSGLGKGFTLGNEAAESTDE